MNARLRKLPDGSGREGSNEVCWFTTSIMCMGKASHGTDFGEIWWPFALHFKVGAPDYWAITHLPSGMGMAPWQTTQAKARRIVQQLRALPVDWSFTKPSGPKWRACKALVRPWLRKRGYLESAKGKSAVDPNARSEGKTRTRAKVSSDTERTDVSPSARS